MPKERTKTEINAIEDRAIALYCLGIPIATIAKRLKTSNRHLLKLRDEHQWDVKKEKFRTDIQKDFAKGFTKVKLDLVNQLSDILQKLFVGLDVDKLTDYQRFRMFGDYMKIMHQLTGSDDVNLNVNTKEMGPEFYKKFWGLKDQEDDSDQ